MNQEKFDLLQLNPSNHIELFQSLMCIGRIFTDHCWPNLEAVLEERLLEFRTSDLSLDRYTRLSYLAILLFFSYLDSAALSTKKLLLDAENRGLLEPLSKNHKNMIKKPDARIKFDELMKVQFAVLPHAIGIPVEYGTLRQNVLPDIFKLRKIRNRLVHPMGLEDLIGVDVTELDGHDINLPISDFMHQLSEVLARCARKLVPPENRHKVDLRGWLKTRQPSSDGGD